MLSLEDRLLQHTSKLAFLSDIFSQTHPIDSPGIELSEEGRSGLGFLLYALRDDASQISTDVEDILLTYNKTSLVRKNV